MRGLLMTAVSPCRWKDSVLKAIKGAHAGRVTSKKRGLQEERKRREPPITKKEDPDKRLRAHGDSVCKEKKKGKEKRLAAAKRQRKVP